MNKREAIDTYLGGRIDCGLSEYRLRIILSEYQDADQYCVVNKDDPNLVPIHIPLPEPPAWHLIDGWNESSKDQMFKPVTIPRAIKTLQRQHDSIGAIWDELEENPILYKEEINFIKKQIWHELNGYWCFINGKPTYLPGIFYTVLNFWHYDGGLPEYRDRDRKVWLFDWWLSQDERFAGINMPKHRREGATSKAGAKNYFTISLMINADSGIQSKTESHAEEVFIKHIVRPWKKLPFWLKPEYDGTDNPKKEFNFVPPAKVAKKDSRGRKSGLVTKDSGLGSTISFRSSDVYAYDTFKLYFMHGDEVGKTKDVDIEARYFKIRECLAEGADIHGWCWHTSTVEDMLMAGGEAFKKLCQDSNYHDIFELETGRTKTWLANLFIPATEGRKNFIGRYGESIIKTPTIEQIEFLRSKNPKRKVFTGSLEDIMRYRRSFEEKDDIIGLLEYKRKYPIEYAECWISANLDTGMPHDILQARMSELSFILARKDSKQLIRKGNFVRSGADKYSRVIWKDDVNGKFEVSYLFEDVNMSNRCRFIDGVMTPGNISWGVAAADPFAYNKAKNKSRMSKGAGAVFMYRSVSDTDETIRSWEGYRFVCVYNHRPRTKDEYHEDMARMCQYYGVLMLSEGNRSDLIDDFNRNGYGKYLKYLLNQKTRKMEVNPGWWSHEGSKTKIWNLLRDYYTIHGHREMHMEILMQLSRIEGIEHMTDYDLFTACGGALLAVDDQTFEMITENNTDAMVLDSWFN